MTPAQQSKMHRAAAEVGRGMDVFGSSGTLKGASMSGTDDPAAAVTYTTPEDVRNIVAEAMEAMAEKRLPGDMTTTECCRSVAADLRAERPPFARSLDPHPLAKPPWEPTEGEYFVNGGSPVFLRKMHGQIEILNLASGHWGRGLRQEIVPGDRSLRPGELIVELRPGGEPVLARLALDDSEYAEAIHREGLYLVTLPNGTTIARLYAWGTPEAFKPEET